MGGARNPRTGSEFISSGLTISSKGTMSEWAAKLLVAKKPIAIPELPKDRPLPAAKSALPDCYNGTEALEVLSARYNRDLAAAEQDRQGEKVQVYRSLHTTSAWTTQGAGGKKNKPDDGGRYNLLDEANRAIARAKRRA